MIDKLKNIVTNWKDMPEEAKAEIRDKLKSEMRKHRRWWRKQFYNTPEKYLPIDDLGDLYIQWFYNRFAALRMLKNMSIFDKAYKILTERKNFSKKTAFGEMHGDGYIWVERHPEIKVIVEEWQSYRLIWIKDSYKFHIRRLYYQYNYPQNSVPKSFTIAAFRKQEFHPYCPSDYNEKRFDAFTYGDNRDGGYVLSMDFLSKGFENSEYADRSTLFHIDSLKYWDAYLNNPQDLE
jgi:hypothetical protein